MRCQRSVLELRDDRVFRALSEVLARYRDGEAFRVVHFSIQNTHLHAIVEAANDRALAHGMRSLAINAARAIHRVFGGCGRVFFRYHSSVITTRRYARHAIAYVLGNWRRHHEDFANGRLLPALLDRYSSALSFDGWSPRFRVPAGHTPLPVSRPRTHLLRRGWAYDGPLDPWHAPGPLW